MKETKVKLSERAKEELEEIRVKIRDEICKPSCSFYKECYNNDGSTKSECKIRV